MGYYMRFITSSKQVITLTDIENTLREVNPAYQLEPDQAPDMADLLYAGKRFGLIEINHPDEEIFEDDLHEFTEMVGEPTDVSSRRILEVFATATLIVAVEAFWEDGESEDSLSKLDPLWDWLFSHYEGIVQADGEGFYDESGLVLKRSFVL